MERAPRDRLKPLLSQTLLIPASASQPPGWTFPWVCLSRSDEQILLDAVAKLRLIRYSASPLVLCDLLFEEYPAAVILRVPHLVFNLLDALQQPGGDALRCLARLVSKTRDELANLVSLEGHALLAVDPGALNAETLSLLTVARTAAVLAARIESRASVLDYLHGAVSVARDDHYSHAAGLRRTQASSIPLVCARRVGMAPAGHSLAQVRERFLSPAMHPQLLPAALPEPYGVLSESALALAEHEYHLRYLLPPRPCSLSLIDDARCPESSPTPTASERLHAYSVQLLERPSPLDRPVPIHRTCSAIAEAALLQLGAPRADVDGALDAPLVSLALSALQLAVDPLLCSQSDPALTWMPEAAECAQALFDAAAEALRLTIPLHLVTVVTRSPIALCDAIELCPAEIRRVFIPGLISTLFCGSIPLRCLEQDVPASALDDPNGSGYTSPELRNAARLRRCCVALQQRRVLVPTILVRVAEAVLLLESCARLQTGTKASLFEGWHPADRRLPQLTAALDRLGSTFPSDLCAAAGIVTDARLLLDASMGLGVISRIASLPGLGLQKPEKWDPATVIAAVERAVRVSLVHAGVGVGLSQSALSVLAAGNAPGTDLTPHTMAIAALLTQVLMVHPAPSLRAHMLASLINKLSDGAGCEDPSESVAVAQWILEPLVFILLVDEDDSVANGAVRAIDVITCCCSTWLQLAGKEIPLEVALAAPLLDVAALYLSSIDKPDCRDLSSKIELVIGLIRHRRAQTSPEDLLYSIRRLFASSSDARRRAARVIQSALALVDKENAVPCEDCDPVADAVSSVLGLRAEALPLGTLESSVAAHLDELRLLSNGGNVPRHKPDCEISSASGPVMRSTCDPHRLSAGLASSIVSAGRLRSRLLGSLRSGTSSSAHLEDSTASASSALEPELLRVLLRAMASPDLPLPQKISVLHQLRDAVLRDAASFTRSDDVDGILSRSSEAIVSLLRDHNFAGVIGPQREAVCACAATLHAIVSSSPICRAFLREKPDALLALLRLAFNGPSISSSLGSVGINSRLLAVRCLARLAFEIPAFTSNTSAGLVAFPHDLAYSEIDARDGMSAVLVPIPAWLCSSLLRSVALADGCGSLRPALSVVEAAQPIYLSCMPPPVCLFAAQQYLCVSDRPYERMLAAAVHRDLNQTKAFLQQATSAKSPAAFIVATRALCCQAEVLSSSRDDLLSKCDILGAFFRFTSVSPRTPEDFQCLEEVLHLYRLVLSSGSLPSIPEAWQARAWALLSLCDTIDRDAPGGLCETPASCLYAELAEYVADPHSVDAEGPSAGLPTVVLTDDAIVRIDELKTCYWHYDQPRWRLLRAILAFARSATSLNSSSDGRAQLSAAADLIRTTTTLARVLRLLALPELDELTQTACFRFIEMLMRDDAAAREAVTKDGGREISAVLCAAVARCSSSRFLSATASASFCGIRLQRAALRVMVELATWSARHSTTTGELPVLLAPDLWQDPATRSFIWLARLPTHRDEEFRLAYFALMDSFLCTPATWAAFFASSCVSESLNVALALICRGNSMCDVVVGASSDTLRTLHAASSFLCNACAASSRRPWYGSAAPTGIDELFLPGTLRRLLKAASSLLEVFPCAAIPPLRVASAIIATASSRTRPLIVRELDDAWTSLQLGDAIFSHVSSLYQLDTTAIANKAILVCTTASYRKPPKQEEEVNSYAFDSATRSAMHHSTHHDTTAASVAFSLITSVLTVRGPLCSLGVPVPVVVREATRILQQYAWRCAAAADSKPHDDANFALCDAPALTQSEHQAAVDCCDALTALLVSWANVTSISSDLQRSTFPLAAAAAEPTPNPVHGLGSALRILACADDAFVARRKQVPPSVLIASRRLMQAIFVCLRNYQQLAANDAFSSQGTDGATAVLSVLQSCGWLMPCPSSKSLPMSSCPDVAAQTILFSTLASLLRESSSFDGSRLRPTSSDEALAETRRILLNGVSRTSELPSLLAPAVAAVSSSLFEPREAWAYVGYTLEEGRSAHAPLEASCAAVTAALECNAVMEGNVTIAGVAQAAAASLGAVERLLNELSTVSETLYNSAHRAPLEAHSVEAVPRSHRRSPAELIDIAAAIHRASCAASLLAALLIPDVTSATTGPTLAAAVCVTGGFAEKGKAFLFAAAAILSDSQLAPFFESTLDACERVLGSALNLASSGAASAGLHLSSHSNMEVRGGRDNDADRNVSRTWSQGSTDTETVMSSPSLPHNLVLRNRKPVYARAVAAWRSLSLLDVLISDAHAASEALLPQPIKRGSRSGAGPDALACSLSLLGSAVIRPKTASQAYVGKDLDGCAVERNVDRIRPASILSVSGGRGSGTVPAIVRCGSRTAAVRLHGCLYSVLMASAHLSPVVRAAIVARQLPQLLCERLHCALRAALYSPGAPPIQPAAAAAVATLAATELRFLAACASPGDMRSLDAVLKDAWFRRTTVMLLLRGGPPGGGAARRMRGASSGQPSVAAPAATRPRAMPPVRGASLDVSATMTAVPRDISSSLDPTGASEAVPQADAVEDAEDATLPASQAAPETPTIGAAECDARIAAATALLRNCLGGGGTAAEDAWHYDDDVRDATLACLTDSTVGVRICAAAAVHGLVERSARVRAWFRNPSRQPVVASLDAAVAETAAIIAHLEGPRVEGPATAEAAALLRGALAQLSAAVAAVGGGLPGTRVTP